METAQIQSFLQVVETGSISRAAKAVHLTQPAVTKQIMALERELKTPLFDRTGRGMQLTAAGELLSSYARRSMALQEECRQAIADLDSGESGELVIGAGVTTSIFQLPHWLQALKARLPGLDVTVRTGSSREVVQWTLEREILLGLVTTPVEHRDLTVKGLFDERIVLVASPDMAPASPMKTLTLPLILFPRGSGFRDYLDRELSEGGIDVRVKMETDSLEAIKSFVASGLGASFLPAGTVAREIEEGVLRTVSVRGLARLRRRTSLIYRSDRHLGAGAKAFIKVCG